MGSSIVLKGIELSTHCGVTAQEREKPQLILVDVIFRCPNASSFLSDQIQDTVDYGSVINKIQEVGQSQHFFLLEALAERLSQVLFKEFPLTHLKLWVRKTQPPISNLQGSVGVQLHRAREASIGSLQSPSPFLISQFSKLKTGHFLDVATGQGRHALYLAKHGFSIHGIDRDATGLTTLNRLAQKASLSSITTEVLDLEKNPLSPPDLGTELYDGILVFFYLYRPLFPRLAQALKPGGILLYETFHIDNHHYRQHPRRQEFCLRNNELLTILQGFRILYYEEGDHVGPDGRSRSFTTRALAQKIATSEYHSHIVTPDR